MIALHDEDSLELIRRQKILVQDGRLESTHKSFKNGHESKDPSKTTRPLSTTSHPYICHITPHSPNQVRLLETKTTVISDFLDFIRPLSFPATRSRDHPITAEVAVPERMERLDTVEKVLKKLGSGVGCRDNSG